jgi:hypothetical protein
VPSCVSFSGLCCSSCLEACFVFVPVLLRGVNIKTEVGGPGLRCDRSVLFPKLKMATVMAPVRRRARCLAQWHALEGDKEGDGQRSAGHVEVSIRRWVRPGKNRRFQWLELLSCLYVGLDRGITAGSTERDHRPSQGALPPYTAQWQNEP